MNARITKQMTARKIAPEWSILLLAAALIALGILIAMFE